MLRRRGPALRPDASAFFACVARLRWRIDLRVRRSACPSSPRVTVSAFLSSRNPRYTGCRRIPSAVHSVNLTCATRTGSNPVRPFVRRHLARERRRRDFERFQQLHQSSELALVEAGADVADVLERAAIEYAEQQRAEVGAALPRLGPAADHELLLLDEFSACASPSVRLPDTYCEAARFAMRPSHPLASAR